jgi:hypothetical protein
MHQSYPIIDNPVQLHYCLCAGYLTRMKQYLPLEPSTLQFTQSQSVRFSQLQEKRVSWPQQGRLCQIARHSLRP